MKFMIPLLVAMLPVVASVAQSQSGVASGVPHTHGLPIRALRPSAHSWCSMVAEIRAGCRFSALS